MKLNINIPGFGSMEVEGDDTKEIIREISFWSSLPSECPICKASVRFFHRTAQEFMFWGMFCTGPTTHQCNFGQHKKDGKLFYYGPKSWKAQGYTEEEQGGNDGWVPTDPYQEPEQPARSTPVAPTSPVQSANVPETGETPKQGIGSRDAFWKLFAKVGVIEGELTSEEKKRFITNLGNGKYPETWTPSVWWELRANADSFINLTMNGLTACKEGIPTEHVVKYFAKCFPDEMGIDGPIDITGEQWGVMAKNMEQFLRKGRAEEKAKAGK